MMYLRESGHWNIDFRMNTLFDDLENHLIYRSHQTGLLRLPPWRAQGRASN